LIVIDYQAQRDLVRRVAFFFLFFFFAIISTLLLGHYPFLLLSEINYKINYFFFKITGVSCFFSVIDRFFFSFSFEASGLFFIGLSCSLQAIDSFLVYAIPPMFSKEPLGNSFIES
jgi:hypothetical protein